ncbi:MAG: ribosome maturation factor RimP [Nitrosomonadales bacterium]|jgi:ribosome maturation factor RimP
MDIEKTVAESLKNIGYELVDFEFNSNSRLIRVFIDNGAIVSIDDCQKVSNHLSQVLSVEMDYDYDRLEVSSPGMDRKLNSLKDFQRFIGEEVKIKTNEALENNQRNFNGKILGVNQETVFLEIDKKSIEVPFDKILKARLNPKF